MTVIYLANGEYVSTVVNGLSPEDSSGYVLVDGREVKVMPLAAPYKFLGYGEVVTIHLQDGKPFVAVLQPQEYEHHVANIDVGESALDQVRAHNPGDIITSGESTFITAVYEQATGQWREMTDQEYEKERRAWSEDMKDMQKIRDEWRAYRDEGT